MKNYEHKIFFLFPHFYLRLLYGVMVIEASLSNHDNKVVSSILTEFPIVNMRH